MVMPSVLHKKIICYSSSVKRIQRQCKNLQFCLGSTRLEMFCFPTNYNYTLPVSLKNRTAPTSREFSFSYYRLSVQQTTHSVAVFSFQLFFSFSFQFLDFYMNSMAKMLLYSGTFYNEISCAYDVFSSTRPKLSTVMESNPSIIPYPCYNKHTSQDKYIGTL